MGTQPALQPKTRSKARKVPSPTTNAHPAAASTAILDPVPTAHDIAALAYSYWEAREGKPGSPEEDWLRAEAELRAHSPGESSGE
jgi:hypothetical protein